MGILYTLFAIGFLFGLPVVAIVALVKGRSNARALTSLHQRLDNLERSQGLLESVLDEVSIRLGLSSGPETDEPEPEEPEESEDQPATPAEIPDEETTEESLAAATAFEAAKPKDLEEKLTSGWLVWLGAITIALAGVFLVKYAVESGWLRPAVRDLMGVVLGVALAAGGEWLRRRPLQRAIAAVKPNYVPPAFTASGLFIVFASIYAAYALHHLLQPPVAFLALAATAFAAVGLAVLHGPFVATLGLLGAYVTPFLVRTDVPSAWILFGYLFVVTVANLMVVRYRAWLWLAYATLAGASLWPIIWFVANWKADDAIPVGLFLLLIAVAFLLIPRFLAPQGPRLRLWRDNRILTTDEMIGWVASGVAALLVFMLVRTAAYGIESLIVQGLLCALFLIQGRRAPAFDGLPVVSAASTLILMATWHLPELVRTGLGDEFRYVGAPIVPPEFTPFITTGLEFGVLFGVIGYVVLWGAKRPAIWAGLSAGVPVLMFVILYWRIVDFGLDLKWALVSLALAAVSLAAATGIERYRNLGTYSVPLGFYAAAVVAFVSLGVTMLLQQAWLTVALSLEVAALAWISGYVGSRSIHVLAAIVAAVVLIRLTLNFNVLDYEFGVVPSFSWVIYGYGIPAAAFLWAARVFRRSEVRWLVVLLEAGVVVFGALLVSLELRLFIAGSLDSPNYNLLEQSLQTIAWMSVAYGLGIGHRMQLGNLVSLWGARILTGLAAGQIVFLQLWISNPVLTQDPVGDFPFLNILLLAYAVPAVFAFIIGARLNLEKSPMAASALKILGLVLVFAYVSLELKRAFQGPVLVVGYESTAEFYSYSVAWLFYALVLLGLGIYKLKSELRHASLVVLLITIVKVFVFDMEDLTGLYRVASFLGLGLSLVGIGYIYQRFMFSVSAAAPPETGPPDPE